MPCPGPFHFSYSVDYIYDFCPLPDPDVGLSILVCDIEHTSFHFSTVHQYIFIWIIFILNELQTDRQKALTFAKELLTSLAEDWAQL